MKFFNIIKADILQVIDNKYENIKWRTYTTDFQNSLFNAFGKTFNFIKNLRHVGRFFHFLKNVRKYLIKNGFTKTEKKNEYDYLMKETYKLPFIKNIDLDIENILNKIESKNKNYKDYIDYFRSTWAKYFKDKTLCLN